MIDSAERTLDLQYFIFRGDVAGDEQVLALDNLPNVQVRVFNPFVYRGHANFMRAAEFLFNARRLDHRMHNKLIVVDNSAALVGGRNIGDQYFQIDPESQFADDDVFVAGPVASQLSISFDEYWNSELAIPAAALHHPRNSTVVPAPPDSAFSARIASGEPYASMSSGRLPLIWARAWVVCDSPYKKQVEDGARAGRLMSEAVFSAVRATSFELLMVTPYFIPASEESRALAELRRRQVRNRLLTNSLEGSAGEFAHSGY